MGESLLQADDPADFASRSKTLLDVTKIVRVAGHGPGVIVMTEMPGLRGGLLQSRDPMATCPGEARPRRMRRPGRGCDRHVSYRKPSCRSGPSASRPTRRANATGPRRTDLDGGR